MKYYVFDVYFLVIPIMFSCKCELKLSRLLSVFVNGATKFAQHISNKLLSNNGNKLVLDLLWQQLSTCIVQNEDSFSECHRDLGVSILDFMHNKHTVIVVHAYL